MPKYKSLQRPGMTWEQSELSNRLRQIRAALPWQRPALITLLALEQGVSTRTIRRWLEREEEQPENLLKRRIRADSGTFRLPDTAIKCILNYFWENPDSSVAKAHAQLIVLHPEAMTYQDSQGRSRLVSIGTVLRIQRIFRNGWNKEVKRSGSIL